MGLHRNGVTIPLLLLVGALTACGGLDARSGTVSASPPPVRSGPADGWTPAAAWTMEEDLRLTGGERGGRPFGRVAAVEVDALGRLWVADGIAAEVRVFEADGRPVRTVGRKGAGPGEFQQIVALTRAPDGRMWVLDPGNARWTVLDTAGAPVATHRREGTPAAPWRGGFDARGRLLEPVVLIRPGESIRWAVLRWDAGMEAADTLHVPPHDAKYFEATEAASGVSVPYTGARAVAVDPSGEGVWIGVTDRYRLDLVAFEGDTLRALEHAHADVPVSDAEVDAALAAYRDLEAMGVRLDRSRVPRVRPPMNAFVVDDSGRIWVSPARRRGAPMALEVFEADGRFAGAVELPRAVSNAPGPVVRGDALYGVVRDRDGVESVVRLRIRRPG